MGTRPSDEIIHKSLISLIPTWYVEAASALASTLTPLLNPVGRSRSPLPRFSDLLKTSFSQSTLHKGYCKNCRRWPQLSHHRAFSDLPAVLILDAALDRSPKISRQIWSTRGWLPEEIGISLLPSGDIDCFEGQRLSQLRHHPNVSVFELVGLVAEVSSLQGQPSHLVSLVNGGILLVRIIFYLTDCLRSGNM